VRKYTAYDNVGILLAQTGVDIEDNIPDDFDPNYFKWTSIAGYPGGLFGGKAPEQYLPGENKFWEIQLYSPLNPGETDAQMGAVFSGYFKTGQYISLTGANGQGSSHGVRRIYHTEVWKPAATEIRAIYIPKEDGDASFAGTEGIKFHAVQNNLYHLPRVQSSTYSMSVNRETVNQISYTDSAVKQITSPPEINFEVDYLVTSEDVEKQLGLYVGRDKSCIYNIYKNNSKDERSIILLSAPHDGDREINFARTLSGAGVLGLGNCYLNSYSMNASVGSLLSAKASWSASNMQFDTCDNAIYTGQSPAINLKTGLYEEHQPFIEVAPYSYRPGRTKISSNPKVDSSFSEGDLGQYLESVTHAGICKDVFRGPVSAFSQGDITLILSNSQFGQTLKNAEDKMFAAQSFDIELAINRNEMKGFGSNYVFGRKLQLPLVARASISLLKTDIEKGGAYELFEEDRLYTFEVDLNQTSPNRGLAFDIFTYRVTNARLVSKSYSLSIGSREQVEMTFDIEVSANDGLHIIDPYDRSHERGYRCC
jgi:hypothetical protein